MAEESFGDVVRRLREARSLSARELSTLAGLTHPTILRIEDGQSPTFESVGRIARALGISLVELVGNAGGDSPPSAASELPGWDRLLAEEKASVRRLVYSLGSMRATGTPEMVREAARGPVTQEVVERLQADLERLQETVNELTRPDGQEREAEGSAS